MAHSEDTDEGFVPLDVGKAGASASIDVHVSPEGLGQHEPRFVLLMIKPPKGGWNTSNDAYNISLYRKADDLMESLTGFRPIFSPPFDNQQPAPHKGVKLHIVWTEKKSGKVLQDNIVTADTYRGSESGRIKVGFGYSLVLNGIQYAPGDYIATVTAVDNDPRFDGTFRTGIISGYTWK
ncbi:hypothetical protein [Herbaspirillum sp. 1130]|uniref:hypothetical protein n=1 Tax=Herbaspirillum sp. 1130 TaxID=2806562 RepID=UPI001AE17307|nr:hypothetical protein [Herbaspirillum sp. 1130]MBP1314193.1 hypothetical protein [Herbaspirillum sp. 1130]